MVSLSAVGVFIGTAISYCMWLKGSNRNAHAFGAEDMEYTPGWSIGWFFVPLAHLFKPFQVVKEVYRASDPDAGKSDWKDRPVDSTLGLWWGAWIASQIFNRIDLRVALSADPQIQAISPWVSSITAVPNIAAGVLALMVVRHIYARQQEKAKRLGLRRDSVEPV